VSGLAPRAPGDSVGPRRSSDVVVRPLNFTVSPMRAALPLLLLLALPLNAAAVPPVPQTMEDAFHALDSLLGNAQREAFMHKPEREATVEAHMGVGMYVRNQWFRHGGSPLVGYLMGKGAHSLDDASAMLLTSYWRYLNGQPIRLEEQGACYARWGAEQNRLIREAEANHRDSYATPAFDCP
jgi:hypothetical protein